MGQFEDEIVDHLNRMCGAGIFRPPELDRNLITCPNPGIATQRTLRLLSEQGAVQARYSRETALGSSPILVIEPETVVLLQLRTSADREETRQADLKASETLLNNAIENPMRIAFEYKDGALQAHDRTRAHEKVAMGDIYRKLGDLEAAKAIDNWGFESTSRLIIVLSAHPAALMDYLQINAAPEAPAVVEPLSPRHARARLRMMGMS